MKLVFLNDITDPAYTKDKTGVILYFVCTMSLVVWFYLNSFSCQGQSQLKWFTNVSSLLYWRLQTTETPGSFFTTACCPSCKIFFKISNSNVLELYLFINARMAWRTAETCVAKYNWWWVYYQNIVTYLPKCVLEDPCMIVVLYCVNSLLQPTATGGLCGVRLTLYGLVISTAVGSSPAHGPARLYDCATFRGPCCLPIWVM